MWPPETPQLLGGSLGRRPGSSGLRLARCCSREALLAAGEEGEARSCLPGPPAPPMYVSLGSGPVAALPASVPSSTLGPGAPAAAGTVTGRRAQPSGRRANVWQVQG